MAGPRDRRGEVAPARRGRHARAPRRSAARASAWCSPRRSLRHARGRLGHRRLPRRGARRRRRRAGARRGDPRRSARRCARSRSTPSAASGWPPPPASAPSASRGRASTDEVLEAYERRDRDARARRARRRPRLRAAACRAEPGPARFRRAACPASSPACPRRAPAPRSRVARRVAIVGGAVAGIGLTALALDHIGIESIGHALVAATPVWVLVALRADVRLDADPRRGLARDPARRPARDARAPARHRPRDDDRRADVGHAARPAGRALARADHGAPGRPRARPLPGRARHARLADAAEHPRAGDPRRGDVRHRRHLPRRRGRAGVRHDRPGGACWRCCSRLPGAAPARQAVALRARAAGAGRGARERWCRCAAACAVFRKPAARRVGHHHPAHGVGDPVALLLRAARGARASTSAPASAPPRPCCSP